MEDLPLGTHRVLGDRPMIPDSVSKLSSRLMLSAVAVLLAACESATGPQPLPAGVEVRTSGTAFVVDTVGASKRATITGTVTNSSGRTLVLAYCGDAIAKLAGSEWVDVWVENCAGVNGVDIEVAPRATATFGIHVENVPGASQSFDFGAPNAQYRVRVRMTVKAPVQFGDEVFEIQADDRLSNSFSFTN